MTTIFLSEFVGTFVLMFMGNAVSSNVSFKGNKGTAAGYLMCIVGWSLAVFLGVASSVAMGGEGHINPAITAMFLVTGDVSFSESLVFVGSQLLGAMVAQILVILFYWQTMKKSDPETVLGVHSTIPTHKKAWLNNMLTEYVATIMLAAVVFFVLDGKWFDGAPIPVALLVLSIGLSLGGPTGFAINPARDLGPRIVYWTVFCLLPKMENLKNNVTLFEVVSKEKGNAQWSYSWIPVIMPTLAGITVGAFSYL